MECKESKGSINAYLDKELTEKETSAIQSHLQECPTCAKEMAELDKVRQMVKSLPKVNAPAELVQKVKTQLTGQPVSKPVYSFWRRYRWIIHPVAAAAVLLLVYVNITHWLGKPESVTDKEISSTDETERLTVRIAPETPERDKVAASTPSPSLPEPTIAKGASVMTKKPKSGLTAPLEKGLETKSGIRTGEKASEPMVLARKKEAKGGFKTKSSIPLKEGLVEDTERFVTLSQEVHITCADINTTRQILDNMISPKLGEEESRARITLDVRQKEKRTSESGAYQSKQDITNGKRREWGTNVIKVILPLDQKDAFIEQLKELGDVKVSRLDTLPQEDKKLADVEKIDQLKNNVADRIAVEETAKEETIAQVAVQDKLREHSRDTQEIAESFTDDASDKLKEYENADELVGQKEFKSGRAEADQNIATQKLGAVGYAQDQPAETQTERSVMRQAKQQTQPTESVQVQLIIILETKKLSK